MAHSQSVRAYKIFRGEVLPPFELVRTLSNGDLVGKCFEEDKSYLTNEEVLIHIGYCHFDPEEEIW